MDFMNRGVLELADLKFAVLDEVDRMLDIGFREDIRTILGRIKAEHQTIFVSATIDDEIKRLARKYMVNAKEVNVSQDRLTVDDVDQYYVTAEARDKFRLLRLLFKQESPDVSIIFCNTKHAARKLTKKLHDAGIEAMEIHGDLMQRKRDRVMEQFRKHKIRVLVATDLAARGIDVSAITHIFNYDIPQDSLIYVHRIGRTARMGAKGIAITFVTREQGKELTMIEALINREIPLRKVNGFTPSPPPSAEEPVRTPQVSRLKASVYGDSQGVVAKAPAKTLGSRFRTKRRRRRL